MIELSNSLADLAERVKVANEASALAERTTIEKAIEAGELLCQAKDEARHGEWLPFLDRACIPERKAQRLMQLARSGLKSDTCRELGGIKGALYFIAKRNAAVEMLSSIADVKAPTDDIRGMIAFHVDRASRLRKTFDFIGEMYETFSEESKASAERDRSPSEGHPMSDVVLQVWTEVDAMLVSENLGEAYLKFKTALLHCANEPSHEAYVIVGKASRVVLDMLEGADDMDLCFKISTDDKTTALAAHVDDIAKAGGWLQ